MRFTRVCASIKRAFEFSLVLHHNACVSHAFLHSITTSFAFFFVLRYTACVSHDWPHVIRRVLRFYSYRVTMHAFHTLVCIY